LDRARECVAIKVSRLDLLINESASIHNGLLFSLQSRRGEFTRVVRPPVALFKQKWNTDSFGKRLE
jgi:hypothetical protein